uniref:Protein kinase domain-containing protein n=1 Tax=Leersia perrieri TaxID=77586 RepID=A0A0D9XLT4_9ORYZ
MDRSKFLVTMPFSQCCHLPRTQDKLNGWPWRFQSVTESLRRRLRSPTSEHNNFQRNARGGAAAAAALPVLLLLNCAAAACAATAAETRALLEFKAALTDDPGGALANWTLAGDPCRDFAGVSCDPASGAVQRLRLHGEGLEGALSPSLARLPALESVSLFGNRLAGVIPASFVGLAATLHKLNLSGNALSGEIPAFLGSFPFLRLLDLSYNAFSGEIPAALFGECPRLRYVSLAHNSLTGRVPPGIGNCVRLAGFDFSYNNLDGELPEKVCAPPEMSYISVRSNSLAGAIDGKLTGCRSLDVLDVGSNNFSGDPPFGLLALVNITYFNVSSNNFSGEIPAISTCGDRFAYLDASRNRLDGAVPETVANCRDLNFLDFSENALSGEIPPELGDISNLAHFNVSFNNLTGSIPSSPLLQQFGPTAFMGNPLLCGPPLENPCAGRNARRLGVPVIIAIVVAAAILVGICIISAMNIKAYKRRREQNQQQLHDEEEEEILVSDSAAIVSPGSTVITGKLVLFRKNSFSSRYEDWEAGTKAVLDKNCLVGVGSIGAVYRASFETGVSIAVKKLDTLGRIKNQDEFEHEMGRLRGLIHPNLVTFYGYYWSPSTQLLLSEFVDNGNTLHDHLHGNRRRAVPVSSHGGLCWERRFKIAVATARAIAYLHHDCKPQVLHLNIKSRNILLDSDHEAKLSDFGLVKLLPEPRNLQSAAAGYVAPELASSSSSRYSDKCDVFSFGVVLLEIVTGRKPVSSSHGHGTAPASAVVVVLRDYVREILESGTVSGCFDRSLRGFVEAELVQVLKLGLVCTSETPSRRPSMAEVVQFLESIRSSS